MTSRFQFSSLYLSTKLSGEIHHKIIPSRTCIRLLLLLGCAQALDRPLEIVLFLLHVLNGLVAFAEQALKAPNLREESAADFEREFCIS